MLTNLKFVIETFVPGGRRVPPYIAFILTYLSRQVSECRHFPCAANVIAFAGIGGWLPDLGADGQSRTTTYLWFSQEITKEELPWVFE